MKFICIFLVFIFSLLCKGELQKIEHIEFYEKMLEPHKYIDRGNSKSDTLFNEIIDTSDLDKSLLDLIPNGYEVHDFIKGDLNKDSLQDYVFLVGSTNLENFEENQFGQIVDRNRQGIIIVFGEGNRKYKKVVENLACFPSNFEDSGVYYAPELYVGINKKNNLEINYAHGRYGSWGFVFRYQNNGFELIGSFNNSNRGPVGLFSISINYSTKKKKITTNINADKEEENEIWVEKWEDIKVDKLLDLNEAQNIVFDEELNN